jgi:hypothetical protein
MFPLLGPGCGRFTEARLTTGVEIVSQLLVSTATPMALVLLGNTSSEGKITRPRVCFFPPYHLREKIDLYLSQ